MGLLKRRESSLPTTTFQKLTLVSERVPPDPPIFVSRKSIENPSILNPPQLLRTCLGCGGFTGAEPSGAVKPPSSKKTQRVALKKQNVTLLVN